MQGPWTKAHPPPRPGLQSLLRPGAKSLHLGTKEIPCVSWEFLYNYVFVYSLSDHPPTIGKVDFSVLTGKYLNECLKKYPRFQLIHMVSRRVNELQDGAKPLVKAKLNSPVEIALQEIAEGKIIAAPAHPLGEPDESSDDAES